MSDLSEKQIQKFIDDWYFAAYERKKEGNELSDYQRGVADTYEIVSRELRLKLKNNKEIEEEKLWNDVVKDSARSHQRTKVLSIIAGILIPAIPLFMFLAFSGYGWLVVPIAYIVFLVVAGSTRWQKKQAIDAPILFIFVGIALIMVQMFGENFVSNLEQVMVTLSVQIMGAALAGGLVLWVRQKRSWSDLGLATAIFCMGFATLVYYKIGTIADMFKQTPGLIGFEVLGAGVTILVISGWIED